MMSQYAQVQTYATCKRATFPSVLQRYQNTLQELGCRDRDILDWVKEINWPATDEDSFGDIYASPVILTAQPGKQITCAGIEISLYTHLAVPSIEELPSWVGFNLLFETESLKESQTTPYKRECGPIIWHILQILAKNFTELGAYFTDEWQENQAWRAIVEDAGDPWLFDLGIFPRSLAQHFAIVPPGFKGTVTETGFAFAQDNRWEQIPWEQHTK